MTTPREERLAALVEKWESLGVDRAEVVKGAHWKRTVWRECARELREALESPLPPEETDRAGLLSPCEGRVTP